MKIDAAIAWCTSLMGGVEILSDHSKVHGGHESSTHRLRLPSGYCYLKVHETRISWNHEVHAYERWTGAFGDYAPRLIAVHDHEPFALIMTELPGDVVESKQLSPSEEQLVWRAAGAALVNLHKWETGQSFGPCWRDGTPAEKETQNASAYVFTRFNRQIAKAIHLGYLTAEERAILQAACDLIPAFEGERPIPCHRDYCAANWLIGKEGLWAGVIDFEFAYWDVRVADFSRDPNWSWINRPDLVEAFFEGYGLSLTHREEQQLIVAHAEYALGAILWGHEHAFYGFEQEGHDALAHLATFLN